MNSFSYTSTFYMYIGAIDFKLNVINDVLNDEDKNERIVAADLWQVFIFRHDDSLEMRQSDGSRHSNTTSGVYWVVTRGFKFQH